MTDNQVIKIIKTSIKVLAVALFALLIWYLRDVLAPFVVGFMGAYVLNPIVNFFERKLKKRFIAVFVTLILFFGTIFGIGYLLLPQIVQETSYLYNIINGIATDNHWFKRFSQFDELPDFVKDNLNDAVVYLTQEIAPAIANLLGKTFNFVSGIFGFAIVVLYLIFIMLDFEYISKGWKTLIPSQYRKPILQFFDRFKIQMQNYLRGQSIIALIVGILFCILFSIIGLPIGITLGILVGILNLVPYLQVLAFVPAIILCAIASLNSDWGFWTYLFLTAGSFVLVQIIQDLILTPKIMGKHTGLNPAIILLSLAIWGKLLGFLGLLLAIPFTCLVSTYWFEYLNKNSKNEDSNNNIGTNS